MARKHTAYIERDLPQFGRTRRCQLVDQRHTQERRFQAYKEMELAETQAHDLVVQALE